MKYIAIFPALCAFVALILSFLCVFAGSKTNYLEDYAIVSINTSRIAVDVFDNNPSRNGGSHNSDGDPGFFDGIAHDINHEVHHLSNDLEGEIEHALNDALSSFASKIGLHDFYSIHVLDFCEGFYAANGSTAAANVTHCSSPRGLFSFKPSQTLRRELRAAGVDVTLEDLHWPSAIDEAVDSLALAFNIMFVLYCIAIAATGLSFWTGVAGVFFTGRALLLVNICLTQGAAFALLVASAIVTGAANKATDVINEYGAAIDVNAKRGTKLIALTWTAMLLVFLASAVWMTECCAQRRKEKKMPKEYS